MKPDTAFIWNLKNPPSLHEGKEGGLLTLMSGGEKGDYSAADSAEVSSVFVISP